MAFPGRRVATITPTTENVSRLSRNTPSSQMAVLPPDQPVDWLTRLLVGNARAKIAA